MSKPVSEGNMWRVYAGVATLPKLSGTDKSVLAVLVDCADADGKAWPSEFTISTRLKIQVRCVGRSIANLIRSPYVTRQRRMRTSNVYAIDFEAILTDTSDQKPVRYDAGVRSDRTETSDQTLTDTSDNQEHKNRNIDQERGRARGSRLSENWYPSSSDLDYARSLGMPEPMIAREVEKFRNHWYSAAGKNAIKRDWSRAFRNWCIRGLEYLANDQRRRTSNRSPVDILQEAKLR